ncbi:hypothetical protein FA13DRAFT_1802631 [Coprinellus micaceus]|uniref:Uncharacterized protein n=1 Tax=Coprinellus micaceus TaxID=71717 RepID=A0A4Y7SBQ4_COPMI|nr:hypothetical protein FA13DRAFT_1802631 [Coprinellus micaceus]
MTQPETNEDILYSADALGRGASGARADDLKTMKTAVIDWITPEGGVLIPPLQRNVKTGRGFYHETTGSFLCPTDYDWSDPSLVMTGLHWPRFLYQGLKVNPENAWDGLFRSKIMLLAYKHIFISPSAASGESRATRAGNAQIHGMTHVTPASIAYVATLLRFSLSHWNIFNRNDKNADSERFYAGILDFLEDPQEQTEVDELMKWWNSTIFPVQYECGELSLPSTSALAALRAQRRSGRGQALRTSNIQNGSTGAN